MIKPFHHSLKLVVNPTYKADIFCIEIWNNKLDRAIMIEATKFLKVKSLNVKTKPKIYEAMIIF